MSRTGSLSRLLLVSMTVFCFGLTLATPLLAFAAVSAKSAPDANGTLDLQTWAEGGQLIVVTAVAVPESVKLPTVVRVPLVEGATVQWVGEILGGDIAADPERAYTIKKSPAGGQYAEFEIKSARTAQVDAWMSGLTTSGDSVAGTFEWIQSVSSPSTSFSVRVPPNSKDVVVSPKPSGQPSRNAEGESLYFGDPIALKPGSRQTVSFSYSQGAAANGASSAGGSANTVLYVLLAALVIAVVALAVVIRRQREAGQSSSSVASSRPRERTSGGDAEQHEEGSESDDAWGFDDAD